MNYVIQVDRDYLVESIYADSYSLSVNFTDTDRINAAETFTLEKAERIKAFLADYYDIVRIREVVTTKKLVEHEVTELGKVIDV